MAVSPPYLLRGTIFNNYVYPPVGYEGQIDPFTQLDEFGGYHPRDDYINYLGDFFGNF